MYVSYDIHIADPCMMMYGVMSWTLYVLFDIYMADPCIMMYDVMS